MLEGEEERFAQQVGSWLWAAWSHTLSRLTTLRQKTVQLKRAVRGGLWAGSLEASSSSVPERDAGRDAEGHEWEVGRQAAGPNWDVGQGMAGPNWYLGAAGDAASEESSVETTSETGAADADAGLNAEPDLDTAGDSDEDDCCSAASVHVQPHGLDRRVAGECGVSFSDCVRSVCPLRMQSCLPADPVTVQY
jgi:hypothetical protein